MELEGGEDLVCKVRCPCRGLMAKPVSLTEKPENTNNSLQASCLATVQSTQECKKHILPRQTWPGKVLGCCWWWLQFWREGTGESPPSCEGEESAVSEASGRSEEDDEEADAFCQVKGRAGGEGFVGDKFDSCRKVGGAWQW